MQSIVLGDLRLETRLIDDLVPSPNNPREHSPDQVEHIAASFDRFGINNPIIIGPDGGIIAGVGRWLAAKKLELKEIPVLIVSHLTPDERVAYMIADNQLGLLSSWNPEILVRQLERLVEQNIDLAVLGFSDEDLEKILPREPCTEELDADAVPEIQPAPVSRLGDLWELDDHRVLCGDGTNIDNLQFLLAGQPVHMTFTDPPYNVAYTGKTAARMTLVNDNLGDGFGELLRLGCRAILAVCEGGIYIAMSSAQLHLLYTVFCEEGGHWSTFLIWVKNTFTLGRADYQRQFEPILYGWREGSKHYWCGARDQGDVWFVDKPFRNDLHPTAKPTILIERGIRNSSKPGQTVFDPFGGAGSTIIACENLNRKARLVEIDPHFVDVTIRRWERYTGRKARLVGGNSFDDVAEERKCELSNGGQDHE